VGCRTAAHRDKCLVEPSRTGSPGVNAGATTGGRSRAAGWIGAESAPNLTALAARASAAAAATAATRIAGRATAADISP
jgi:hypothetical protein